MSDVSCRVIADMAGFLEHKGIGEQALFTPEILARLPPEEASPTFLKNPKNRVPWSTFAILENHLDAHWGGEAGRREFIDYSVLKPSQLMAIFRPVLMLATSPKQFYRLLSWAGKGNFGNLTSELEDIDPHTVRFTIRVRPGDEEVPSYFPKAAYALSKLPRMAGFPESLVDMKIVPGGAVFDIRLPRHASRWSLLNPFQWRSLFLTKEVVRHLIAKENDLRDGYQTLLKERQELENIVQEKTRALSEANTKLEALVKSFDGTVLLLDRDSTIRYISFVLDAFKDSEVVGSKAVDYLLESSREPYLRGLEDAYERGITSEIELQVTQDMSYWSTTLKPFSLPDGKRTVMAIARDITEQKNHERMLIAAREQAFAANNTKSAFLANMSHEMRTPMTAILGFSDLLHSSATDPQVREYSEIILRNGQHLLNLISDVLDIAKIEGGYLEKEVSEFNPVEVLEGVVSSLAPTIKPTVRVSLDVCPSTPEMIHSDPTRVRQILLNLIGNAAKFTAQGTIGIRVEEFRKGVRISISDTGCGIPADKFQAVFTPFTQADVTTSRKYGGTGLGLSLSRKIADILGGTVSLVASKEDEGSTFCLEIPSLESLPAEQEEKRSPTHLAGALSGLRILVVEDHPDICGYLKDALERAGATIDTAADGQIALQKTHTKEFDLILMDLQLPVIDGYETTRLLRAYGNHTQVVALTAHAKPEDRDRCLQNGFDDYISKPISGTDLVRYLSKTAPIANRFYDPGL